MKKPIYALLSIAALAACELPAVQTSAREAAKAVVRPIVAETVPGPSGVILTDCIIDNASTEELARIAAGGNSPENVTLVSQILQRPETVACATAGLTA